MHPSGPAMLQLGRGVCVHQPCDLGRIAQLPCTSAFPSEKGRG